MELPPKHARSLDSETPRPTVKGLVLAGGKSKRMQQDKGLLDYHGLPQREYMYQLLQKAGLESVYFSCREDQVADLGNERCLPDRFVGLGPFGGLLTFFQANPQSACLVVACDQPFMTERSIELLLRQRNHSLYASAFHNPMTGLPEPLMTIWEPRSYERLLHFKELGCASPREVLIQSDIQLLDHQHPLEMQNVNHPEEYAQALAKLKKQQT